MRSRPRASVEHSLDTARLVLGFLDPGEGFSVGPGLPSFTRGSRIAPSASIPIAHRTSAVEVTYPHTINYTIVSCSIGSVRVTTMMTTNPLVVGGKQQMLDISSSIAILARSNKPSSIDDAAVLACFACLLLPSDHQNPINGLVLVQQCHLHWVTTVFVSGIFAPESPSSLSDSGNSCPSAPGTTVGEMG
ncbi:hypothetical protein ASPBRDRAFT_71755 [Aspergillus brasiliensis CBS 101740]|uniref:Uncharacterized protein n=1 Tax=Aspergillus brasiliensis (strain CBS 101740 / IMI 381727 / IBT 21946) TaxID=767769 RepID=A0A1L9UVM8_ASPBC|nr:hypothetical protein ASPBRDRAFT_71755 [Aspergillus brasiliensis CBS 101740]